MNRKEEILREISTLTPLLEIVQLGYVKPDSNKDGNSSNATGVIRDAKDAKGLYLKIIGRLETLVAELENQ